VPASNPTASLKEESVERSMDRPRHKPPVLLLHGICSDAAVFRPVIGPGLARLLSANFTPIPGSLRTGRPVPGRPGWDFDDHLFEDVPRLFAEAERQAGEPPCVLGYSMGGMLALTAQALGLIRAPRLIILGSPFIFPAIPFYPALMRRTLVFADRVGLRMIPIRLLGKLLFLEVLLFERRLPADELRLFHALVQKTAVDIPVETLRQAVGWVTAGRLLDRSGTRDYFFDLHKVTVPTRFIVGGDDRIAPFDAVRPAYERISSRFKDLVVLPHLSHFGLVGPVGLPQVVSLVESWFLTLPSPLRRGDQPGADRDRRPVGGR